MKLCDDARMIGMARVRAVGIHTRTRRLESESGRDCEGRPKIQRPIQRPYCDAMQYIELREKMSQSRRAWRATGGQPPPVLYSTGVFAHRLRGQGRWG